MAGLHETTARLRKLRAARAFDLQIADDCGMSEYRGFGFNPGGLRMLTYTPARVALDAPLVVVLHGCAQRAGSFARAAGWLDLADRLGFVVLAPEQICENNPNRCFNWFEPADIARDSGEAASIHAMVDHLISRDAIDAARVFVTGLSAGGAMTAALLAAYPETFAGGAVLAGVPFGLAHNMAQAFSAMRSPSHLGGRALGALVADAAPRPARRPRLAIWHGEADSTVARGNAYALARQWTAVHELGEEPDETLVQGRWTRSNWRAPDGAVRVELNLLAGLGHGAPLAAQGPDPIGEAGPFMLEAGVSSSMEIARFWGLAPQDAAQAAAWGPSHATSPPCPAQTLANQVLGAVSPHVRGETFQVIAKALKSAGLA